MADHLDGGREDRVLCAIGMDLIPRGFLGVPSHTAMYPPLPGTQRGDTQGTVIAWQAAPITR